MKEKIFTYLEKLQNTICKTIENADGKAIFKEDIWHRKEGGGGKTRIMECGKIFEKAGVNISRVWGQLPENLKAKLKTKENNFFACGLSLVIHPDNPFVPTVHANWRYFEMYDANGITSDSWFGGGQDLTPYYLFEEDAVHFHKICKRSCDKYHPDFYKRYKQQCDAYFWNDHRKEARGIGGLFFDYLREKKNSTIDHWYNFIVEVSNSFLESYLPIVEKRKVIKYGTVHKKWQEIRRGRYVEFNLIHDKGTLFGLKTGGRTESILMSLPPSVRWHYDYQPLKGSEEEILTKVLKQPKEWVL